jgi:hypothetical protein
MFVGENDPFPPHTSASLRLLFDFLPALMGRSVTEKTHTDAAESMFTLLLCHTTSLSASQRSRANKSLIQTSSFT